MKDLRGRVAVVTGGGSGIGLALARRFAREGMQLVLADVEQGALQRAVASLQAGGAQAIGVATDVTQAEQVGALADAAYARFGAVHVLCNNAGVSAPALRLPLWETRLADWDWVMGVNLMGVVHGLRTFVPRMLAGGDEGHVVNTASVAGLVSGSGPYFASKHAVTCLTEGLYRDLRTLGARVSASVLCPGVIHTGILDAERNRPAQFGPPTDLGSLSATSQSMAATFRAALEAGWEPSVVADAVAEAIVADRFYVVPAQPEYLALVRLRAADLAELRNPTLLPG